MECGLWFCKYEEISFGCICVETRLLLLFPVILTNDCLVLVHPFSSFLCIIMMLHILAHIFVVGMCSGKILYFNPLFCLVL